MQTTIEIDDELKQELDERARDAGTSTSALATAFIREGLERSPAGPPRNGARAYGSHRATVQLDRTRLSNGLPQLYLEPGTEISLDTLTNLMSAVEADDDLGPPLHIDAATRAEITTYAHERNIPIGLLAARLLQQSLLYRNEWPSWHGIPQIPSTRREPVTLEFVKQLQEELDLEDLLD